MSPSGQALSLRTNFKWTLVGNIVYTASQAGVVLVLGRWAGPELLGRWTLALAIVTPILILAALHLHQVQVTDARDEFSFEHYLGTRIITTLLALLAVAGVALLGPYEAQAVGVIIWLGVARSCEAISEIVRAFFQRHERMNLSALSVMIKGPVELGALIAVYAGTQNLIYCAAAVAAVRGLALLCFDLPVCKWLLAQLERATGHISRLRPSFDLVVVRRLVWRALPAGLGIVLYELANVIPRYFVERYHGETALGYYGAMDYAIAAVMLVVAALGQSACPRLAHYYAHERLQYRRLLRKLLMLGAVVGLLLIGAVGLAGGPVMGFVLRPDYGAYWLELVIMAGAGAVGFLVFFTGVAVVAARAFWVQLASCGLSCLTAVLSSWWLVPPHGVRGGAAAILVTRAVLLACHLVALAWLVREPLGKQARGNRLLARFDGG